MEFDIYRDFGELLMALFLVIGLLVAFGTDSLFVTLSVVFLLGLIFGRLWFRQRSSFRVILSLVIMGLLLGLWFGDFLLNVEVITLFFFLGFSIGYYAHYKGWFSSVEF